MYARKLSHLNFYGMTENCWCTERLLVLKLHCRKYCAFDPKLKAQCFAFGILF